MIKKVPITDFCPTQNKEIQVDIDYIDISTKEDTVKTYSKGLFECPYDPFGDKCSIKDECPIKLSAPQIIH
jgi:hypothetical protein